MSLRYAKIGEHDYPEMSDETGRMVHGFVTEPVGLTGTFNEAVHALAAHATGRPAWTRCPPILMTTRRHWSGYSEYTVTSQWSEIVLTVVDWNWEHEWSSLAEFFTALATANPEADA